MKSSILILLSLIVSCLCSCNETSSSQPSAVIQMEMMFDMGWEDVIEVKNCGSNEEMALEIIEGLNLVSQKHGRISRTYRVKQD